MKFQNTIISYSILNIQTERLTAENSWISHYVIYDHTKDEVVDGLMLKDNYSLSFQVVLYI
jgi:hypothetical protein